MSCKSLGQVLLHIYSTEILGTYTGAFAGILRKKNANKSQESRGVDEQGNIRGMLILLWGIVAHEVNGILPYFSPHVHPWTHVHSTAHSVSGCPDQL